VANGVTNRAESTEERTTAMNYFKLLLPKALWTPSCKAQEVSPAHFTQTGVEDAYPAQKPLAKKSAKVHVASNSVAAARSKQAVDRKKNAHRTARKQEVVLAQGI
jgi:hypothetical protein